MKMNFYLQHPLMAIHDPHMKALLEKEGMKGYGAYWIILNYQLFSFDEEGCFMPIELNSPQKKEDEKENETAISAQKTVEKTAKIERKLNENTPLLAENQQKGESYKSQNTLNDSDLSHNTVTNKEYIYIITSSSSERKKETSDDDGSFIETLNPGRCAPSPAATSSPPVKNALVWTSPPANQPNHALKRPKPRGLPPQTTGLTD